MRLAHLLIVTIALLGSQPSRASLRDVLSACNPLRLLARKSSARETAPKASPKPSEPPQEEQAKIVPTPSLKVAGPRVPALIWGYQLTQALNSAVKQGEVPEDVLLDAAYTHVNGGGLSAEVNKVVKRELTSQDPKMRELAARIKALEVRHFDPPGYPAWNAYYWEPGLVLLRSADPALQKEGLHLMARAASSYQKIGINWVADRQSVLLRNQVSEEVFQAILPFAKSEDPEVRASVAEILASWNDQGRAKDALNSLSKDPVSQIREIAGASLSFAGDDLTAINRVRFLSDRLRLMPDWDKNTINTFSTSMPFFLKRYPQYREEWGVLSTLRGFDEVVTHTKGTYHFDPATKTETGDPQQIHAAEFIKNGVHEFPNARIRVGLNSEGKMAVRFEQLSEKYYRRAIEVLKSTALPPLRQAALTSYLEEGLRPGQKVVEVPLDPDDREEFLLIIQMHIIGILGRY